MAKRWMPSMSSWRAAPIEEQTRRLTATLREQQAEAAKLDEAIARNFKELGYGG
jgi:type I restriction enzyme M protein